MADARATSDSSQCGPTVLDQGAVFGIGAAFLRAPADAEVSIAKRQHRFQLGQEFGICAPTELTHAIQNLLGLSLTTPRFQGTRDLRTAEK